MPEPSDKSAASEIAVTDELLRLSERLRALAGSFVPELSEADRLIDPGIPDPVLAQVAVSIVRARERRSHYFQASLFGEPAWDLLLHLFVNRAKGVYRSTKDACIATGTPMTTALRCLANLEKAGLVRRFRDKRDRRVALVELTQGGFEKVRGYIAEGIGRNEMPASESAKAA